MVRTDARGATLVEYAILVGVVALFAAAGFRVLGRQLLAKTQLQAECVAALDAGCRASTGESTRAAPQPSSASASVTSSSNAAATGWTTYAIPKPTTGGFVLMVRGMSAPPVVATDAAGDLTDQWSNSYTATFDGRNVTFTRDDTHESFDATWMRGTPVSGIRGSGALDHFQFTFSDHGPTQSFNARWTFDGSAAEARAALEKAGYEHRRLGFDFGRVEYRMPSDRRSTHFVISNTSRDPSSGALQTHGDVHDDAYDPLRHPLAHLGEVVPVGTFSKVFPVILPFGLY